MQRSKLEIKDEDKRRKRRWIVLGGLVVWLVWISGVFGNRGLIQAYNLSQVRRDMSLRIVALENERSRLENTLSGLDSDPYVQEQTVRETLGFMRQNELVFEFR